MTGTREETNGQATREDFAAYLLRMRGAALAERRLMTAIEITPRRGFISGVYQNVAFSNRMIPIDCGEAIEGIDLQTKVLAKAAIEKNHRVLEIGTGSGYTSAVMGRLAARVTTVDRYKTLAEQARQRHIALGIGNVVVRQQDGSKGLPGEGPFDRIISWVAFDAVPREFIDTLASGGVMIVPIGPGDGVQTLTCLTKVGSRFEREDFGTARLQAVIPGIAQAL